MIEQIIETGYLLMYLLFVMLIIAILLYGLLELINKCLDLYIENHNKLHSIIKKIFNR